MGKILIYCLSLLVLARIDSDRGLSSAQRTMAITIDDLPLNSLNKDIPYQRTITKKLVEVLSADTVPAIGFVNEGKLYDNGDSNPGRIAMLQMWLDAGLTLGNHTYSHPDYHNMDFEGFRQNIEKGEEITRKLLQKEKQELRYFRHPFLHTGNTPDKKKELHNYLHNHGYVIAPVTIDNSEWIFARAYEKALLADDNPKASEIGEAYIDYMEAKTAYYEEQSRSLFDREIAQILLIHANALNGDYLDELITMLKHRGYRFKKLDDILKDPAYNSPDTYTGEGGISWIHRWALTEGKSGDFFAGEPAVPEFVMNYSELFQE